MQSYKRKITYFFQHHNGNVGSTAGFLKLEIRGDSVKININIQEPADLPYKKATLYFYHEAGDKLVAVPVDKIDSDNGILTYQTRTSWQNMYGTGRDLYTFDGVTVMYNDSHYYIGDFKDKERKNYSIEIKEPVVKKEEPVEKKKVIPPLNALNDKKENEKNESESTQKENKKTESEGAKKEETVYDKDNELYKCDNCPYMKKRAELEEPADSFEKMLAEYPKLPMHGVTELFDCVRIHPKDIGKLDIRNWKLGVNSFLTHGFYTYQYLLLGKMRFDNGLDKPIIGVPGVYSNREKYLANMFGFEQFIPVKKTGVKTGEFGYWIVEISPYL